MADKTVRKDIARAINQSQIDNPDDYDQAMRQNQEEIENSPEGKARANDSLYGLLGGVGAYYAGRGIRKIGRKLDRYNSDIPLNVDDSIPHPLKAGFVGAIGGSANQVIGISNRTAEHRKSLKGQK